MVSVRMGIQKKDMMKNKNARDNINNIIDSIGMSGLRKRKDKILINPRPQAMITIVLYPSLWMYM